VASKGWAVIIITCQVMYIITWQVNIVVVVVNLTTYLAYLP
jgi:hypothetical protein